MMVKLLVLLRMYTRGSLETCRRMLGVAFLQINGRITLEFRAFPFPLGGGEARRTGWSLYDGSRDAIIRASPEGGGRTAEQGVWLPSRTGLLV